MVRGKFVWGCPVCGEKSYTSRLGTGPHKGIICDKHNVKKELLDPEKLEMKKVAIVLFALLTSYSVANGFSITLAWDANTEPDLKGYQLYYGRASGDYNHTIDVGNVTEYTIVGFEEGEYFFAATAYDDDDNESAYSEELRHTFVATKINSEISSPNDLHRKGR